ncbi:hypothetical protein M514_04653 [Trichuris suis]|uniref:Uncharacterized protein n=1 Tax=Trichuris suis TaxID=68888 RepID=A0A085MBB0_9BILA|nr:hypothetical protein M513_04653 [Trichuris suis]KFD73370.1 hypothetical protein M514_04653 [Trichuris suis]
MKNSCGGSDKLWATVRSNAVNDESTEFGRRFRDETIVLSCKASVSLGYYKNARAYAQLSCSHTERWKLFECWPFFVLPLNSERCFLTRLSDCDIIAGRNGH